MNAQSMTSDVSKLKTKVIKVTIGEFLLLGLMLFGSAGTLSWTAAWVWIGILFIISIPMVVLLLRDDPDLLRERLKSPIQADQKGWDKVLLTVLLTLMALWLPLMGLDAVRYHWSHMSLGLQLLGTIVLCLSLYVICLCFRENSFLAPVVKIQTERGHHVVSTGPYSHVRHPMYSGALLYFPGTALLLGSWYGFAMGLVLCGLIVLRTLLEDRTLQSELPGYAEYASKVRFRLIPHIW